MYRLRSTPLRSLAAASRAGAIARHMANATHHKPSQPSEPEPLVKFAENLGLRHFALNRPGKLNTLNTPMIDLLGPMLAHWEQASLVNAIVGTGTGRAFCAGGDVAEIVNNLDTEEGRAKAILFFQQEFGLDYFLALLGTPYVAVMDGITFGGGFGLAAPATFRIATEKTQIAMPETKIGYFPDVGASYYLSRLDGEIGTYLALTGNIVKGRAAFELGLATHYIPSNRVELLKERMAALEEPAFPLVNSAIEELYSEPETVEPPSIYTGIIREALDDSFKFKRVEEIIDRLRQHAAGQTVEPAAEVAAWAKSTLALLEDRSPTSLRVALKALRLGRKMNLLDTFNMELRLASVFCSGAIPDFKTGVTAVVKNKSKERPEWSPATLAEVSEAEIDKYFEGNENGQPQLITPELALNRVPEDWLTYALPTEKMVEDTVKGRMAFSPNTASTLDELLNTIDRVTEFKHGAREKVLEIVDRKCVINDKWVEWK